MKTDDKEHVSNDKLDFWHEIALTYAISVSRLYLFVLSNLIYVAKEGKLQGKTASYSTISTPNSLSFHSYPQIKL
jgi:hypothetical protein